MTESGAERVILLILEILGLGSCIYGLWFQYANNVALAGILFCSVWYILGGISHLLGLITIVTEFRTQEDEDPDGRSQVILQYHYLCGWLAVILGYPLMVNYTWLMLYPTYFAYLHLILSILPLITWIAQSSWGIVRTTQICTFIAAASHFTVCFMADDFWGWSSAIVMVVNLIALSTPTRYHLWAFNSRELFVIGLVVTSILMNNSILVVSDPNTKKPFK